MFSDTMMLGGGGRKAAYSMENSLLFRGGHLTRTFSGGNRKTWTRGGFVRLADLKTDFQVLFACGASALSVRVQGDSVKFYLNDSGIYSAFSEIALMDTAAWSHWHFIHDLTQSSGADYYQLWWNGVRHSLIREGGSIPTPEQNHMGPWNQAAAHNIGDFRGYLAEEYFLDGFARQPGDFGETDPVTGSWRPRKATGVNYGITGFHLGKPWNSTNLGTDYSGQGNHWTATGFIASDVVLDAPTNVFATLNPIYAPHSGALTFSNGNLTTTTVGTATMPFPSTGEWWVEVEVAAVGSWTNIGVAKDGADISVDGSAVNGWYYSNSGQKYGNSANVAYGASYTTGDKIGLYYSSGSITMYKWSGSAWVSQGVMFTGLTGTLYAYVRGSGSIFNLNFGQKTLTGAVPGTAKALCTANLPATTGQASGSFIGNASLDGPCVYTGAVPQSLTINNKAVKWGIDADKLATGFKVRSASVDYNAPGSNSWEAAYNKQPTVGTNKVPATAQVN